jgi:hypothetical protein
MAMALPFHRTMGNRRRHRPENRAKRVMQSQWQTSPAHRSLGKYAIGGFSLRPAVPPTIPVLVVFQVNTTSFGGPEWADFRPIRLTAVRADSWDAKKLTAANLRQDTARRLGPKWGNDQTWIGHRIG